MDLLSSLRARLAAPVAIACIGFAVVTPGTAAHAASISPRQPDVAKPSGTVNVAYASSLEYLDEKVVGPAFTKAEGYTYSGRGASSGDLEADIASGEISPNVFESVGGDNITPLEPKFTNWYVQYAGTSIVVAYNPKSQYASQFAAIASGKEPLSNLFTLMEQPGFKLGRTDPNIDPQGRDFIFMLELAQSYYHLPASTVTKSWAPRSTLRVLRRSSARPRSMPRCNPVNSMRLACSSPRPSSCICPTSSSRPRSTSVASPTLRCTRKPPSRSPGARSRREARKSST